MLPKDPVILLSYVNTKLRDAYPSLRAFCEETDTDPDALITALDNIGYRYDESLNQFR